MCKFHGQITRGDWIKKEYETFRELFLHEHKHAGRLSNLH